MMFFMIGCMSTALAHALFGHLPCIASQEEFPTGCKLNSGMSLVPLVMPVLLDLKRHLVWEYSLLDKQQI